MEEYHRGDGRQSDRARSLRIFVNPAAGRLLYTDRVSNQLSNPSLVERIKVVLRRLFVIDDKQPTDVPNTTKLQLQEVSSDGTENGPFDFSGVSFAELLELEQLSRRYPKIANLVSFHRLAKHLTLLLANQETKKVMVETSKFIGELFRDPKFSPSGDSELLADLVNMTLQVQSDLETARHRFDAEFRSLYGEPSDYRALRQRINASIAAAYKALGASPA